MGKKSRRPGRNEREANRRRNALLGVLPRFDLPYPIDGQDAPDDPTDPRQLADFVYKNFRYFNNDKQNEKRFLLFRSHQVALF